MKYKEKDTKSMRGGKRKYLPISSTYLPIPTIGFEPTTPAV